MSVDYPIHELIKCCGRYPVYRENKSNGDIWVECECCRKRTLNTFRDRVEAGKLWNEKMLRVRNPLRTLAGKAALLSMIDEDGLTQLEVAEKVGIPKSQIRVVIHRIREEFKDIYGASEDQQNIGDTLLQTEAVPNDGVES